MKTLLSIFAAGLLTVSAYASSLEVRRLSFLDSDAKVAIKAQASSGSIESHMGMGMQTRVFAAATDACAEQGREPILSGAGITVDQITEDDSADGMTVGLIFHIPCRQ